MKVHDPKSRQPEGQTSSKLASSNARALTIRPEVDSIIHWQRTIGNQALQRLLSANDAGPAGDLGTSATNGFAQDFSRIPVHDEAPLRLQAKFKVNSPGDKYEQQADRVAEQVTSMNEPRLQRACDCGGSCATCQTDQTARTRLQMSGVQAHDGGQIQTPSSVNEVLRSPGQPLDESTREFMESRFGHDFSAVRVHADAAAEASANGLRAQAYTVGRHIIFGPGQYRPRVGEGTKLLAHELTHVVQQSTGPARMQRKSTGKDAGESEKDPLCQTFDFETTKQLVSVQASAFKAEPKTLQRHELIRTLKVILRCATPEQQAQIQIEVIATVGEKAGAIWKEAGTAFGGYTGMYPGYASDIKQNLKRLGVDESSALTAFDLPMKDPSLYQPGFTIADRIKEHRARSKKAAKAAGPNLERTDIIYFRGHQYAQYTAPGVFANASSNAELNEKYGFDLRYIEKAGGFPNVKLMISTSCATLCTEALKLFTSLFPNAVILGFRKSDPALGGGPLRDTFEANIKAVKRPLLLDQPADVGAVISAWKSAAEKVKGDIAHILPGYYDGEVHYWDGKAWQTIAAADAKNKCTIKKDARQDLPAPR